MNGLKRWNAVKNVLDLTDEGISVFDRKKDLVDNTLERIYAGLLKFVTKGEIAFLQKYFSGKPAGKVISLNGPAGTVTTFNNQSLISSKFIQTYYGNGGTRSVDEPCPTITTKDRCALINPQFNSTGASVEKPCFTLIARMDKRPPSMVTTRSDFDNLPSFIQRSGNALVYHIYETDSAILIKIKEFMAEHGITDILMRMLRIDELLRIMGFGDHYIVRGTQTEKKKFIGNAVECTQARVLAEAIAATID
jgi:DNA (cytosine-5)-methyltransferase 1